MALIGIAQRCRRRLEVPLPRKVADAPLRDPQLEQQLGILREARLGERAPKLRQRGRDRPAPLRDLRGLAQRRDHPRLADRIAERKVRGHCGRLRAAFVQQARGRRVPAGPRRRRDRVVDGVAEQRVHEAEARTRLQDPGLGQEIGGRRGGVGIEPRQRGGVVEGRGTEQRRRPRQLPGRVPQPRQTAEDGAPDRGRVEGTDAGGVGHLLAHRLLEQLAQQEGVAAAGLEAGLGEARVGPGDAATNQLADRVPAEGGELDRLGRGLQPLAELRGLGRGRLARAPRQQDCQRQALGALGQVEQEAQRRRIGPVDVVHREQERCLLAQVDRQPVEPVEEREGGVRIVGREDRGGALEQGSGQGGGPGQQLRVPLGLRPDRLGEELDRDPEGEAALEVVAPGREHLEAALAGLALGHTQERRLADPGRAAHHDQGAPPLPGASQKITQPPERLLALEQPARTRRARLRPQAAILARASLRPQARQALAAHWRRNSSRDRRLRTQTAVA